MEHTPNNGKNVYLTDFVQWVFRPLDRQYLYFFMQNHAKIAKNVFLNIFRLLDRRNIFSSAG